MESLTEKMSQLSFADESYYCPKMSRKLEEDDLERSPNVDAYEAEWYDPRDEFCDHRWVISNYEGVMYWYPIFPTTFER